MLGMGVLCVSFSIYMYFHSRLNPLHSLWFHPPQYLGQQEPRGHQQGLHQLPQKSGLKVGVKSFCNEEFIKLYMYIVFDLFFGSSFI